MGTFLAVHWDEVQSLVGELDPTCFTAKNQNIKKEAILINSIKKGIENSYFCGTENGERGGWHFAVFKTRLI